MAANDVRVETLGGSGRNGRVTKDDVERHLASRLPSGGATETLVPASYGVLAVEVVLPAGYPAPPGPEATVDLVLATSRALRERPAPDRAPVSHWADALTVRGPGVPGGVVVGHTLLSREGLARVVGGEVPGDEPGEPGTTGLAVRLSRSPGLELLPPGRDAAVLVCGSPTRRPVVVSTGADEVLAVRSVVPLQVCYDPARVDRDQAAWLVEAVAHHLERLHPPR